MTSETNYYQYSDPSSIEAVRFIDETIDSIILDDARIERLSGGMFSSTTR